MIVIWYSIFDPMITRGKRFMKAYTKIFAGLVCLLLATSCPVFAAGAADLDTAFGGDGLIATAVGDYEDNAYAVAVQDDGKILVGGSSLNGADYDFALVRYNPDGTLDSTFNYNGIVTTQVGRSDDEIAALAVQEDGYIIAAGYSKQDGNRDFAIVRYTPDGQRDSSFGQDGIVTTAYGSLNDEITAVTLDDAGRILIAGYSAGTSGRAVIVGRYLADGYPDPSFGYEGINLTGIGDDALARSIAVDEKGKIVVAGSFSLDGQTEVMVLRFSDTGELDSTFGVDGLALTGYTRDTTEGYGIRIHENGAILVAGSVGSPGEVDAALFKFNENGQFDASFGDSGMLEFEASLEDDMALAIDIKDNVVYLSGFTTVNGVRQFLFISLVVSAPEIHTDVIPESKSVPFAFLSGNTTTSLKISERQVMGSYDEFMAEETGLLPIETTISQAAFDIMSDDVSYAVAVQPDGKAVAAGISEDNGVVNFAVARFADDAAVSPAGAPAVAAMATSWIVTKDPFEVTRTGAISGGVITATGIDITKRGVVFSIAPDPVYKEASGSGDPGNGNSGGTDTTPPSVTVILDPSGVLTTPEATLLATTDEVATCRYATSQGVGFDQMTNNMTSADGISHSASLTGLSNGDTFSVRCEDSAGNQNTTDTTVTISLSTSAMTPGGMDFFKMNRLASQIGGFVVGTANAQTTTTGTTDTTTTPTSVFDTTTSFVEEGITDEGGGTGAYSSIIRDLKPGTFYYLRAYALGNDGTVYYGNQVGFKTADSCFIATAAYGSIMHASVKLLREFRDQYLLTNTPGKIFVKLYYKFSPPIAEVIAGNSILRGIVRLLLLPFVGMSWLFLNIGGTAALVVITALFLLPFLLYRRAYCRS